jgi:glutamate--cysteine ligase
MQSLIDNPEETPSARLLAELRAAGCSFFELAMSIARGHRDYFAAIAPLSAERQAQFELAASESIAMQQEVEASDTISLDEYLATYFSSE